jgi:hypothetical protein
MGGTTKHPPLSVIQISVLETPNQCKSSRIHRVLRHLFQVFARAPPRLHESFVFGQFMQAENTPLSLQILRQRRGFQLENFGLLNDAE